MRIAVIVAVFVVLCAAALVGVVAPASGQTLPPPAEIVTETPTPTPCAIDCGPVPTPRPTDGAEGTPDPGCTGECNPVPTPRPTDSAPMTPAPGCEGVCFPFPTPRPTIDPDDAIGPAQPETGPGIWHYEFIPMLHR